LNVFHALYIPREYIEYATSLYSFRDIHPDSDLCSMEIHKKGKLILLFLVILTFSSCAGGRRGSFRRIKGHKVWIPSKGPKLRGRYERCYNFSN
jgi:hypothetical protein